MNQEYKKKSLFTKIIEGIQSELITVPSIIHSMRPEAGRTVQERLADTLENGKGEEFRVAG